MIISVCLTARYATGTAIAKPYAHTDMNSKQKGKAGELEWKDELIKHGHEARRGVQYSGLAGNADVVCESLPIHFEVKRAEKLNVYEAVAQAVRDCPQGKWRAVAHRRNRSEWLVTMTADDWFDLIKEWKEQKKAGF